jgi:hypothetical protein
MEISFFGEVFLSFAGDPVVVLFLNILANDTYATPGKKQFLA